MTICEAIQVKNDSFIARACSLRMRKKQQKIDLCIFYDDIKTEDWKWVGSYLKGRLRQLKEKHESKPLCLLSLTSHMLSLVYNIMFMDMVSSLM